MVGGTIFHRRVIQREISSVLVLNLSGNTNGAQKHRQDIFVLDSAFALIEGHLRLSDQPNPFRLDKPQFMEHSLFPSEH